MYWIEILTAAIFLTALQIFVDSQLHKRRIKLTNSITELLNIQNDRLDIHFEKLAGQEERITKLEKENE